MSNPRSRSRSPSCPPPVLLAPPPSQVANLTENSSSNPFVDTVPSQHDDIALRAADEIDLLNRESSQRQAHQNRIYRGSIRENISVARGIVETALECVQGRGVGEYARVIHANLMSVINSGIVDVMGRRRQVYLESTSHCHHVIQENINAMHGKMQEMFGESAHVEEESFVTVQHMRWFVQALFEIRANYHEITYSVRQRNRAMCAIDILNAAIAAVEANNGGDYDDDEGGEVINDNDDDEDTDDS